MKSTYLQFHRICFIKIINRIRTGAPAGSAARYTCTEMRTLLFFTSFPGFGNGCRGAIPRRETAARGHRRPEPRPCLGILQQCAPPHRRYRHRRGLGPRFGTAPKVRRGKPLASAALYTDLDKMLDAVKPEAVATFTDTYSHLRVVEACTPRHIPVMMEKPLAVDMKQARAIQQASAQVQHSRLRQLRDHLVSQPRRNLEPAARTESRRRNPPDGRHGRPSGAQGDQRAAGVFRLAERPHEERRRRAIRFRLLRRQPDDLDDGQSAAR
jgi:hypothetical protein